MARFIREAAGSTPMELKLAAAAGLWPDKICSAAGAGPADKKIIAVQITPASLLRNPFFIDSRLQFMADGAMIILFSSPQNRHG
jgi:hypothetical protein